MVGVYKIVNKTNGKVYIGSSLDIKQRLRLHRNQFKKYRMQARKYIKY